MKIVSIKKIAWTLKDYLLGKIREKKFQNVVCWNFLTGMLSVKHFCIKKIRKWYIM